MKPKAVPAITNVSPYWEIVLWLEEYGAMVITFGLYWVVLVRICLNGPVVGPSSLAYWYGHDKITHLAETFKSARTSSLTFVTSCWPLCYEFGTIVHQSIRCRPKNDELFRLLCLNYRARKIFERHLVRTLADCLHGRNWQMVCFL